MGLTFLLTAGMMVLLFLMIWAAALTLPYKGITKNFPKDVQERLAPRLDNLPMSGRRAENHGACFFRDVRKNGFQGSKGISERMLGNPSGY